MEILNLLIGLAAGISIGILYSKNKESQNRSNSDLNNYVSKELYTSEKERSKKIEKENREKEELIGNLKADISSKKTLLVTLNSKLDEESKRLIEQQKQLQTQFENMANKIFEKKSEKFAEQNQKNIDLILKPLGEKIKSFEQSVEDKYVKDQKNKASLSEQIKLLQETNQQISQDANNLAKALKGDSKVQGDWGELQLEVLLEKSGLNKGVHFRTQNSLKDEEGKDKRPDCIIDLPNNKT